MLPAMARRRRPDQINAADVQAALDAGLRGFQRLPAAGQLAVVVLLLIGAGVAWLWYERQQQRPASVPTNVPVATGSPHLLLGNPSGADDRSADNLLLVKPYFAVGYDSARGTPAWVSWRLTAADLGTAPRRDDFAADDQLPSWASRITSRDYDHSGFDRGHLCPHGDRMSDRTASYATFVMTNVIPQAPACNQKAWRQCEQYCRDLARRGHRLYVTAGPAGQGGRGRDGSRQTIARGKVVVPADCWKVIVILDEDRGVDPDPATLSADTRVLAVDMPNDDGVGEAWAQYRTTPADIERQTGLRFFDRLRPDVAAALRARLDRTPLPAPEPSRYADD